MDLSVPCLLSRDGARGQPGRRDVGKAQKRKMQVLMWWGPGGTERVAEVLDARMATDPAGSLAASRLIGAGRGLPGGDDALECRAQPAKV